MSEFKKIEQLSILVNEKFASADTDNDWIEANSLWNQLGQLIHQYGRERFNREKKIKIILE